MCSYNVFSFDLKTGCVVWSTLLIFFDDDAGTSFCINIKNWLKAIFSDGHKMFVKNFYTVKELKRRIISILLHIHATSPWWDNWYIAFF